VNVLRSPVLCSRFGFEVRGSTFDVLANDERRTANDEPRTANDEPRTTNDEPERRTQNEERRTVL